ncbi:hypothetical protein BV898_08754 [Hypsibius exemplaris]|uniref:Coiled-coil domain-containing protein n=1 Tax=Hypsibius exemplaris TaxID=2072580 RepID=A0A1W0WPN9_HYPEX|nr:hypothetical protein BV898_08754 [Hypsibius exemplaris]
MAQIGRYGDAGKVVVEGSTPEAGLVKNVCKQWIVHEDEGLAHRLQKEEFQSHFGHNKEQRRVIRGDIKEARIAFSEEVTEIEKQRQRHLQHLREVEQRDQKLAESLQRKLEEEEHRKLSTRRSQDEELALELQLEEEDRRQSRRVIVEPLRKTLSHQRSDPNPDPNPSENFNHLRQDISQPVSSSSSRIIPVQQVFPAPPQRPISDSDRNLALRISAASENDQRRLQEIEDERLARQLQEMEQRATVVKDDYQFAVESQDAEYARLLDEKEKERLRKQLEKHQAKKEGMRHGLVRLDEDPAADMTDLPVRYHPMPPTRPRNHGIVSPAGLVDPFTDLPARHRITGNNAASVTAGPPAPPPASLNIATLIDPTYRGPAYRNPEALLQPAANGSPPGLPRFQDLRQTVSANNAPDSNRTEVLRQTASLDSPGRGGRGKSGGKVKDAKESCKTQ